MCKYCFHIGNDGFFKTIELKEEQIICESW